MLITMDIAPNCRVFSGAYPDAKILQTTVPLRYR